MIIKQMSIRLHLIQTIKNTNITHIMMIAIHLIV